MRAFPNEVSKVPRTTTNGKQIGWTVKDASKTYGPWVSGKYTSSISPDMSSHDRAWSTWEPPLLALCECV